MAGRRLLPHVPPARIDTTSAVWFITICTLPRGEAQLTRPAVADRVLESVEHRWRHQQWYPWIVVLMPDHCHGLFSFPPDAADRTKMIRDWKHWLAFKAGIRWQTDFFDHRLRDDESFEEKFTYITENPVRAGLVARMEDWPYVWRPPDGRPLSGM